jgi:UTP--glucose-1-phosphate uridylyltransferase
VKIRKAVIPAAGYGTRFLPTTKSIPKEMLPVAGKPVIHYIVESAAASGMNQVILVTGSNKKAVEDYFDRNFELEYQLEKTGKAGLLEEVIAVTEMTDIICVRQKQPLGNGHAVLAARPAVGDEPFCVLWGDDILIADPPVPKQLAEVATTYGGPVVGVRRIAPNEIEKYGVLRVEPMGDDPRVQRALSVVEKPRRDEAPSDLAQIGGFILTPAVFDILEGLEVGPSGEIYLADALVQLMQQTTVFTYEFEGRRYDAGNKLDYLRANVELALEDPVLGPEVRRFLSTLQLEGSAAKV